MLQTSTKGKETIFYHPYHNKFYFRHFIVKSNFQRTLCVCVCALLVQDLQVFTQLRQPKSIHFLITWSNYNHLQIMWGGRISLLHGELDHTRVTHARLARAKNEKKHTFCVHCQRTMVIVAIETHGLKQHFHRPNWICGCRFFWAVSRCSPFDAVRKYALSDAKANLPLLFLLIIIFRLLAVEAPANER